MTKIFAIIVAVLATGAMLTAASAQNRNNTPQSSPYKYCLEEQMGGPGGSLPLLCRFVTLQQCEQSKSSPADRCVLNITGQRS